MESRSLWFQSEGRRLQGALCLPENRAAAPAVVLCHGFGSYDEDLGAFVRLGESLGRAGMASFRFSFSGSDPYPERGDIRPAGRWVADCLAAVARLCGEAGIDSQRIGLLGISIGGGVVVQAAALCRQVACVVALAPVADGEAWLRHRWLATRSETAWEEFVAKVGADQQAVVRGAASQTMSHFDVQALPDEGQWNLLLARFPRVLRELTLASVSDTFCFRPLYYAGAVDQPLLVVHGDADESVPLDHGRRIFERAGGPKEFCTLPGAPHCCWETPWEAEVQQSSVEWLNKWLSAA